jgi:hypothetical protein
MKELVKLIDILQEINAGRDEIVQSMEQVDSLIANIRHKMAGIENGYNRIMIELMKLNSKNG